MKKSNWVKASVGLATFSFINMILFVVLSSPFMNVVGMVEDQTENGMFRKDIPSYPRTVDFFNNTTTYYYDSYDITKSSWTNNPNYMATYSLSQFSNTQTDESEYLDSLNTSANNPLADVSYVYMRAYGNVTGGKVYLQPRGSNFFKGYDLNLGASPDWSDWVDITNDDNQSGWSWSNVENLDVYVNSTGVSYANISRVELKAIVNQTSMQIAMNSDSADWVTYHQSDAYWSTARKYTDVKTNTVPILNTIRTLFGLMFVLSMIGLIIWFLLGAHEEEYEEY